VASTRLVKGILNALEDNLGTKIFGAEGRSLATSGAKLVGRTPPGVLAKPLNPNTVHPDLLKETGDPLWRMLHGSNRKYPFDRPKGNLADEGLHLTGSPGIADVYALHPYLDKPIQRVKGPAGPRVYPMLVDPGKPFTGFERDYGPWDDPYRVAMRAYEDYQDMEVPREIDYILQQLAFDKPVVKTLRDAGYDSMLYGHDTPYRDRPRYAPATGKGLMLFDRRRAVPEFSDIGQQAKKARGVLGLDTDRPPLDDKAMMHQLLAGYPDMDMDTLIKYALQEPSSEEAARGGFADRIADLIFEERQKGK